MKSKNNLYFYSLLSKYQLFSTFGSKIVFVSIISAFIPLVPFVMILIYYNLELKLILSLSLLFISSFLIGMVVLSILIKSIISPVFLVSSTLKNYISNSMKPELPVNHKDELGVLMFETQEFIEKIDKRLNILKEDLMVDHLTGVYNRQSAERMIMDSISLLSDNDKLTLAMFDIDDFKFFNDQFGHSFGDECLIDIVNTFKSNLRENDWIARWGGDEFIVFLSNVNYETSTQILDRIISVLDKIFLKTLDEKYVKVSVSVGLYQIAVGDNYQTIIEKVDTALLEAKKRGKSVIVRYDDLQEIENSFKPSLVKADL